MRLHRSNITLLCGVAIIAALGWIGLRVEDSLSPTSLSIQGTESATTATFMEDQFGASAPFAVLLQGPTADLDHQGRKLVGALRRDDPAVTILSPWGPRSASPLRPRANTALILADFHVSFDMAVRKTVSRLDQALKEHITAPVVATPTSFASIYKALQEESLSAAEQGELIALPILLVILLIVFRSPVAALIPLVFGALTVVASRGVLVLLTTWMEVDGLAVVVCTMMGLALGVDYSLLMVSRFREELNTGVSSKYAARRTRHSAGRTTIFAALTLFLSVGLSAFLQPGALLVSMAVTMLVVTAISVAVSWLVLPAVLETLGHNVNRWALGQSRPKRSRMMGAIAGVLRAPRMAAVLITVPLLLLALPAVGFKTGPPGLEELPRSNTARLAAEKIGQTVGAGWQAPFAVMAISRDGPITTPKNLKLLSRWQRDIAADPGVAAVFGPGSLAKRLTPLREFGDILESGEDASSFKAVGQLGPGLHRAGRGIGELREGLAEASGGAGILSRGSGRLANGALQITSALDQARGENRRAVTAINRIAKAAGRLANGQRKARLGSLALKLGFGNLLPNLGQNVLSRARRLQHQLNERAAEDSTLQKLANDTGRLVLRIGTARDEAEYLSAIALKLNKGLHNLASGGKRIHDGTSQLAAATAAAPGQLSLLHHGASRLGEGAEALGGGAKSLQQGLLDGFSHSQPLQSGIEEASSQVSNASDTLTQDVTRIETESPGIFRSGYLFLSALDGSKPLLRQQLEQVINLRRGGNAARFLVISKTGFNSPKSTALYLRLKQTNNTMASAGRVTSGVTGGAATLADFNQATATRPPLVIGTIVLATFLALMIILRAPFLAALAVLLNLLSVAAAIGVVSLFLHVPSGYPLGGHTFLDALGGAAIFGITFGLSIDYAVFLLVRMREQYEKEQDHRSAIDFGLSRTATVITGAAAIMTAVFAAFAAAPVATVSQMGIGLTVAVVLDATVVRIILLPALMILCGEKIWWLPSWLDRILPNVTIDRSRDIDDVFSYVVK